MTKLVTIEQQILMIRGQKILLDSVLAELYGVETGNDSRMISCFNLQKVNLKF